MYFFEREITIMTWNAAPMNRYAPSVVNQLRIFSIVSWLFQWAYLLQVWFGKNGLYCHPWYLTLFVLLYEVLPVSLAWLQHLLASACICVPLFAEKLQAKMKEYTIDPNTRYPTVNMKACKRSDAEKLFWTAETVENLTASTTPRHRPKKEIEAAKPSEATPTISKEPKPPTAVEKFEKAPAGRRPSVDLWRQGTFKPVLFFPCRWWFRFVVVVAVFAVWYIYHPPTLAWPAKEVSWCSPVYAYRVQALSYDVSVLRSAELRYQAQHSSVSARMGCEQAHPVVFSLGKHTDSWRHS